MRLISAGKYAVNVVARAREQQGWQEALRVSVRLAREETAKVFRASRDGDAPSAALLEGESTDVSAILAEARRRALEFVPVEVSADEARAHADFYRYPRFYAGGPVAGGGAREKKILEYFVTMKLASFTSDDVVIDVASEYSIFPELVRRSSGAIVFRQDLIYRPGVHRDCIGGSAASMPVPSEFATKLTLHNSFEHFEGRADTEFVREAARVLRPSGLVVLVPLYLSTEHVNFTDPLVSNEGLELDDEARVVPAPGYRNRLGRFYSVETLIERVLEPARSHGLRPTLYHFTNVADVEPSSGLHFGLVLQKS